MDVNAWPRKKTRQADALGKGPAHGVVLDSAADVKAGSGLALRPTRAAAAPCSDARNDGPRTGPPRHARLAQPRAAEDATGVDGGGVASIVSSDKRPRDAAHAADLPAADDSRRMRRALAASQAAHVADRALPPSAAGASTAASVMQTKTTRAEADDLNDSYCAICLVAFALDDAGGAVDASGAPFDLAYVPLAEAAEAIAAARAAAAVARGEGADVYADAADVDADADAAGGGAAAASAANCLAHLRGAPLCVDSSPNVACDGPCLQSFHTRCLRARGAALGLVTAAAPAGSEAAEGWWLCGHCADGGESACFACAAPLPCEGIVSAGGRNATGRAGRIAASMRCADRLCGKAFCRACLCADARVAWRSATSARCPLHTCAVCGLTPPDTACALCPTAYCLSCVPADALHLADRLCLCAAHATAPNALAHATRVLPPSAARELALLAAEAARADARARARDAARRHEDVDALTLAERAAWRRARLDARRADALADGLGSLGFCAADGAVRFERGATAAAGALLEFAPWPELERASLEKLLRDRASLAASLARAPAGSMARALRLPSAAEYFAQFGTEMELPDEIRLAVAGARRGSGGGARPPRPPPLPRYGKLRTNLYRIERPRHTEVGERCRCVPPPPTPAQARPAVAEPLAVAALVCSPCAQADGAPQQPTALLEPPAPTPATALASASAPPPPTRAPELSYGGERNCRSAAAAAALALAASADVVVGCGDGCLNRELFIECDPRSCPCGEACSNQPLSRKLPAPTEPFVTVGKGWGLRATARIAAGTFIIEYVGEVIDDAECRRRLGRMRQGESSDDDDDDDDESESESEIEKGGGAPKARDGKRAPARATRASARAESDDDAASDDSDSDDDDVDGSSSSSDSDEEARARASEGHFFIMEVGPNAVIDASRRGNAARFLNHSCEPNSQAQKWTVKGETRIGLYAHKQIEAGEEITFDYHFERFGQPIACCCGAANCCGFLGNKLTKLATAPGSGGAAQGPQAAAARRAAKKGGRELSHAALRKLYAAQTFKEAIAAIGAASAPGGGQLDGDDDARVAVAGGPPILLRRNRARGQLARCAAWRTNYAAAQQTRVRPVAAPEAADADTSEADSAARVRLPTSKPAVSQAAAHVGAAVACAAADGGDGRAARSRSTRVSSELGGAAPSMQAPTLRAPSAQAPSAQALSAQALSAQTLSPQAPSARALPEQPARSVRSRKGDNATPLAQAAHAGPSALRVAHVAVPLSRQGQPEESFPAPEPHNPPVEIQAISRPRAR